MVVTRVNVRLHNPCGPPLVGAVPLLFHDLSGRLSRSAAAIIELGASPR